MKKTSVLKIAQMAVLTAIILVMVIMQIGLLRVGPFEIAIVTIPVVVGAMIIGPVGGLVLGTVFGIMSLLQCVGLFGGSVLSPLFTENPFFAFVLCVPTRTFMGLLTGLLFKGLRKLDHTNTWRYFVTGLVGAFLNTLFFMSALILLFWDSELILTLRENSGAESVLKFLVAMVGLNGLVEMSTCCVLGGILAKVLNKVIKKTSDGEYV